MIGYHRVEGYLYKRGNAGLIKTWSKRYFFLKDDRIIYYKDEEHRGRNDMIGQIMLPGSTVSPSVSGHFFFFFSLIFIS